MSKIKLDFQVASYLLPKCVEFSLSMVLKSHHLTELIALLCQRDFATAAQIGPVVTLVNTVFLSMND